GDPAAPGSRASALAPSPPGSRNAQQGHTSAKPLRPNAGRGMDRPARAVAAAARAHLDKRSSRSDKARSETGLWVRSPPAPAKRATTSLAQSPRRPARTPASDSNELQARAGKARQADGTPAHPRPGPGPAANADPSRGLERSLAFTRSNGRRNPNS